MHIKREGNLVALRFFPPSRHTFKLRRSVIFIKISLIKLIISCGRENCTLVGKYLRARFDFIGNCLGEFVDEVCRCVLLLSRYTRKTDEYKVLLPFSALSLRPMNVARYFPRQFLAKSRSITANGTRILINRGASCGFIDALRFELSSFRRDRPTRANSFLRAQQRVIMSSL